MPHLLGAQAVHLEYPTRTVFDSMTLGVDSGDRIGVVGRNGDGKSSLLALLAQRIAPDAGRVTHRGGLRLGVLGQGDDLDPSLTVSRVIVGETAEHVWASDARIREVLAGLVADIPWGAAVGELSGGQRRRVALAALLVGDDDVLFLDEPTNHLDLEAITWLADHLRTRWPAGDGALVVVTHDRWFLDEVCTRMWEVHDGVVEPFEGGYAAYVLQRVERDRQAAAAEAKRRNLMRKELAWLRRGPPARSSKPKFRVDAANALIANEPPARDTVSLTAMAMQRLGKDVVDLVDAGVAYATEAGPRTVLNDVTWRIAPGERTGILGVNGAGKTTLLELIAGTRHPSSGRVKHGKTVKVALLTQASSELDDILEDRVADVIEGLRTSYAVGPKDELTPGQLLERLGFSNAHLATPVKDLSGGQRRRLQLLLTLLDEPNVLILDEPTNDLDTDMLAAMEDLLDSFAGTLIVVSHDRYLVERVTDQQYAILDGHLRHLPGGVTEYLRLRRRQTADGTKSGSGRPASSSGQANTTDATQSSTDPSGAEKRALEKERASIERKLEKLTTHVTDLHERMAEHDPADYEGLTVLADDLRQTETTVAEQETRWLELAELLD